MKKNVNILEILYYEIKLIKKENKILKEKMDFLDVLNKIQVKFLKI